MGDYMSISLTNDMKELFFWRYKKQIDTKLVDEGWIIVFYSFKRDAYDFK